MRILILYVLFTLLLLAPAAPLAAHGDAPRQILTTSNGCTLFVTSLHASGRSGEGVVYVPAVDAHLPAVFSDLTLEGDRILSGTIAARAEAYAPRSSSDLERLDRRRDALPLPLHHRRAWQQLDLDNHRLYLTGLWIEGGETRADLALAVETPEGQVLSFTRRQALLGPNGLALCVDKMWLENNEDTNDPEFPVTLRGSASNLDSASYVEFNCDGFQRFQLLVEYRFPQSMLRPVNPAQNRVRAFFRVISVKLGEFMGVASIDPFEIVGVDDIQFEITGATVDYSTTANDPQMVQAIQPDWPQGIRAAYGNTTWRGFFLKNLSLKLPEGFGASAGSRISLSIEDLIADHGNGVSGKVNVSSNLNAGIEGWAISLRQVLLEVVANSPRRFEINGDINIPIMTGSSNYVALISFPPPPPPGPLPPTPRKAEISLTLSLDGTYAMPFLQEARLTLHSGSNAGISYRSGKFQPVATLHGALEVSISNPKVTFPALTFENFRINDSTLIAGIRNGANAVTGGLDKISVGAFGLGGINLAGSGGNAGQNLPAQPAGGQNPPPSPPPADPAPGAQNQTLAGFPIYVRNIRFGSAEEGGASYYKLNFEIGVNFASGSNAFNTAGLFAVWGGVDFAKLFSPEPWKTVSYHKTEVEGIAINADLGQVRIAGGLRLINNHPTYGSGFKGAIRMDVKLPSAEFFVQCVGQFGAIPAPGGGTAYRYFFVDAEVGFASGLQLGNTGLAIYGFSGGFFYNMERQGSTPEDVAKSKNPAQMPSNVAPSMSGNLLEPGVALSGTVYVPRQNVTSFQVGMIFGLSAPQTLLADALFGMEFNTAQGFAVQKIFFEGGAYVMNPGLTQRQNGAIVVKVRMLIDINRFELVGNFGMSVTVPFGSPEATAMIVGKYNTNLNTVNVYFKFTGQRDFFFYAGTPQHPMNIRFQLTQGLTLGNVNAYFMVGTTMPAIPTLSEVFNQEGFKLPSQFQSLTGRGFLTGDRGVAFGARLRLEPRTYRFLMFSASFRAMAGFDASLMYFNQTPTCGKNGTFGMSNWYLQGQAYGAFYGGLNMDIDLWFYKGRVKIAEIEAGAALQAQLPNPTWMMGFLYGRYSVLGGRVKGSFSFKIELGDKCQDLPAYNPVASIPLIKDTNPADNGTLEVYESPAATFFLPMGQMLSLSVPKDDGSEEIRTYQCFVKEMRLTRKGSNVNIPASIVLQDSFFTAVLQQQNLLEPRTDYVFTIKVSWNEWRGGVRFANSAEEVKVINFRTGDMPNRIVREAVGYHAPGYRQRYWHKNYAKPMLEFRQSGWAHLFPSSKSVSFRVSDQATANSFAAQGWTIVRVFTSSGWRWDIRRTVQVKYVIRLTNVRTGDVIVQDVNGHPGQDARFELAYVAEKGFADGFSNQFRVQFVNLTNSTGKQVLFDALNSLDLVKGDIYSTQIVRAPAEEIRIPVITTVVNNTEQNIASDGTVLLTTETSERRITSLQGVTASLNEVLGEDVLYDDYHFGVSRYNSLNEKFEAATVGQARSGISRSDYGHPDTRLLAIRWGYQSQDAYYAYVNTVEPFDTFDQIKIRSNLLLQNTGSFANPMHDHVFNQRGENLPIIYSRIVAYLMQRVRESPFQRSPAPFDMYNPFVLRSSRSWNWKKARYETRYWEERVANRSGVFTYSDGLPSFWRDLAGWRLNDNASNQNTRIGYWQWQDFVNNVARDYFQVSDWAVQYHFNTRYPAVLRQNEINAKAMTAFNSGTWGTYTPPGSASSFPGSTTLVCQDLQPRLLRNTLQYYQYNGFFIHLIVWPTSDIRIGEVVNRGIYQAMRSYYTRSMVTTQTGSNSFSHNNSATWPRTWTDAYNASGIGSGNRLFSLRLASPGNAVPEYMHSRVSGWGNVKNTSLFMAPYNINRQ